MKARPMKARSLLALAATLASGAALAGNTMSSQQARTLLTAQGYTGISDLEFEHGLWEADARSADGAELEVRLDPETGKLYPSDAVARLTAAEVEAGLTAAGYTRVNDVEFDDGLWSADATDADGVAVELMIDPDTGKVISIERD